MKIQKICSDRQYLKTLGELGLLLIYYTESEIDLIRLFEVGLDLHHLREGFLGVIKATIPIIENTNPVPQHRILL